MSSNAVVVAVSCVALTGAVAALLIATQKPEQPLVRTQLESSGKAPSVAPGDDREIARLTAMVAELRARLEAVERRTRPPETPVLAPTSVEELDDVPVAEVGKEKLARAVEAVLDEKGVEYLKNAQRVAKRESARDGLTKWVDSQTEKLPALQERIAQRLNVDPRRRLLVGEVIDSTFETMRELTDQLHADPPPSEEDQYAIMGEVKSSVGAMVEELDELLEADELIELGEITIESGIPRVGHVLVKTGTSQLPAPPTPVGTDEAPR